MNPNYEFISNHREFMIEQSQNLYLIRSCRASQFGLREKSIDIFSDALIACGLWLKKKSRSLNNETPEKAFSRN